jgi:hypothetical protein
LLDIEPIYPGEGELTSSNRLPERACKTYPKAFEAAAGEIVSTWNADHICRHSQNTISAFILFLFIVLNIFNIFFSRNIKEARISTKSFLIELVKAEFLLAKWLTPIPV